MSESRVTLLDATGAGPPRQVTAQVRSTQEHAAGGADTRVAVPAAELPALLGWTLKPEGLCRDDVCVPVWDRSSVEEQDGLVDLIGVARALDRPVVFDEESAVVAVGAPRADRRQALVGRQVPPLELPDLDGNLHRLEEWHDRRMTLVAFASW